MSGHAKCLFYFVPVLLMSLFIGCGSEIDYYTLYIYPDDRIASNSGVFLDTDGFEIFHITIGGVSGEIISPPPLIWRPDRNIPQGMQRVVVKVKVNGKLKTPEFPPGTPEIIEVVEPDTTSPSLVSSNPKDGNVVPSTTSVVKLTFSEPVVFIDVAFYLNDNERIAQFHLKHYFHETQMDIEGFVLQPDTEYTLTIKGIRDLAWNEAEEIKINFKTSPH